MSAAASHLPVSRLVRVACLGTGTRYSPHAWVSFWSCRKGPAPGRFTRLLNDHASVLVHPGNPVRGRLPGMLGLVVPERYIQATAFDPLARNRIFWYLASSAGSRLWLMTVS